MQQDAWCGLLDYLSSLREHRRRYLKADALGGLEVDDELKIRGLLDRQLPGFRALEELVDVASGASVKVKKVPPYDISPPPSTNAL